jgi:hypothetical protein
MGEALEPVMLNPYLRNRGRRRNRGTKFVPGVNWFTLAHPHPAHSVGRRIKLCPDNASLNGSRSTC